MRFFLCLLLVGCATERPPLPQCENPRCDDCNPLRNAYFGDFHLHTGFSFDAHAYENLLTPDDAYHFAKGDPVGLPPLDADGRPTRATVIDRPLDFVAVTDHIDLLGEVALCTTPGSSAYETERCRNYRDPERNGAYDFGLFLAALTPKRDASICGEDGALCREAATARFAEIIAAADAHYDDGPTCALTTFVGYEYTNTRAVSNLHRNVIFKNSTVPPLPPSYFEAPRPLDLWQQLTEQCLDAGDGCDVVVLPHNSNLSNGRLFTPDYPGATDPIAQAAIAALRGRLETEVEMHQHKGNSECRNGFPGIPDDPLCAFEKLRPANDQTCYDDVPGAGGMRLQGCVHRLDFVRNVLLEGLREQARLGVNPYRLGFIGSTDTHNATPGNTAAEGFPGHIGIVDATDAERLAEGNATHDGVINNPGGLAGVWAIENSREAIFDAFRRRETFATSGPRLRVRLFGGWDYKDGLCDDRDQLARANAGGVPMGGVLDERKGDAGPAFYVAAERDPGGARTPLQRVQIIKGWLDTEGAPQQAVYEVVGDADVGLPAHPDRCETPTEGEATLCAVWRDPDFDPARPALYYARVLEVPTCRWSALACDALPAAERPEHCTDGSVPRFVQQRAWTSPIWYDP